LCIVSAELITTNEAAEILGLSVWTVARWARSGKLAAHLQLASGAYLFDKATIEALLADEPEDAA
jgi:excisionase family DNA binding protein